MGYEYPHTMTRDEISIVCCLKNQDALVIQRKLRGSWKEESVTFLATTRFALHVRLSDDSTRTLKWEDHNDKWKIIA